MYNEPMEFLKRNWVNLWQVAYILLATSWLFAPAVNDIVSSQATSISQFLIPGMPYAWLFRACEFIAAILLLLVIVRLYVKSKKVTLPILLLSIIGFGALADLIVPTTCQIVDGVCQQTASGQVIIHGLETAIVAAALFALTAWDAWKNKRIPSQVFLITQATVGLLLISSWANAHDLTTLLQFFYQGCAVIWIAWFVAGELQGNYRTYKLRQSWVNTTLALWVSLQGLATILIGSLHFELFEGLFTESQAMLFASHSMIVGVIFLYLGRQLMRGERRAWQLLVVLLGLEVIKYSVLLPQPLLLGFYMLTLISTLVSKDFFNRGVVHQTWRSKTYDVVIIASAVIVAMAIIAYLLSYTSVYSHTTAHPHMITLLIIAAVLFMFWAMFRPTPDTKEGWRVYKKSSKPRQYLRLHQILQRISSSSGLKTKNTFGLNMVTALSPIKW